MNQETQYTEEELNRWDENPCWPVHYRRGMPSTEVALRLGVITEADIEEPEESQEPAAPIERTPEREAEIIADLAARGIKKGNYHLHLNKMTDEEITVMLDLTEGKKLMDEHRKAQPTLSDRSYAETLRDW